MCRQTQLQQVWRIINNGVSGYQDWLLYEEIEDEIALSRISVCCSEDGILFPAWNKAWLISKSNYQTLYEGYKYLVFISQVISTQMLNMLHIFLHKTWNLTEIVHVFLKLHLISLLKEVRQLTQNYQFGS